jgi:hypothetical protein
MSSQLHYYLRSHPWDSSENSASEDNPSVSGLIMDDTDSEESVSPLFKPHDRASGLSDPAYSPQPLDPNTAFVAIDRLSTSSASGSNQSPQHSPNKTRVSLARPRPKFEVARPAFENPRPAPRPPSTSKPRVPLHPPIVFYPNTRNELTPPADEDVCNEAEEFLSFLSKRGFLAADRRASSIRSSALSAHSNESRNSIQSSTRGSYQSQGNPRTSIGSTPHFQLRHPSKSSLVVDSRRTSLALRRRSRNSSGVLPPLLADDAFRNPPSTPTSSPIQRETHQSKIVSQMNMSSPSKASFPGPTGEMFNARKRSSVDFSDLELVLAKTCNPALTQLHKTYLTQFDVMTEKIEALSREIDQLKAEREREASRSSGVTTPRLDDVEPFERQISLDVVESRGNSTSSRGSGPVVGRNWKRETPFWKRLLREEDDEEDWDSLDQGVVRRGSILRCVSPKTVL